MKNFAIALIAAFAVAHAARAAETVSVTAPWVRATVPQQKTTGAFMMLLSASDVRLVAVRSPVAGSAELHQMEMKGDTMKMQQVDAIALPAGKAVNLASGGYHVMLMQLKRQLKAGDSVALTLVVEGKDKQRSNITVQVPVKPLGFNAAQTGHH
jgi:copper(I)-binding protein